MTCSKFGTASVDVGTNDVVSGSGLLDEMRQQFDRSKFAWERFAALDPIAVRSGQQSAQWV